MDREKIIKTVEKILEPILEAKNLLLVDVVYKGLGSRSVLSIYIDGKDRPVTLKECEEVSGLLSLELDSVDVIDHSYVLEVSSPGLDRVLKTERELLWAKGKKIRFFLEDGREMRGRLNDFNDEDFIVENEGREIRVKRKMVKKIKLDEV